MVRGGQIPAKPPGRDGVVVAAAPREPRGVTAAIVAKPGHMPQKPEPVPAARGEGEIFLSYWKCQTLLACLSGLQVARTRTEPTHRIPRRRNQPTATPSEQ
jgi:hypothetical protein